MPMSQKVPEDAKKKIDALISEHPNAVLEALLRKEFWPRRI